MRYKPLDASRSEIRTLKVLTEQDGEEHRDGPVHCQIEHIALDVQSSEATGKPDKILETASDLWDIENWQDFTVTDFRKLFVNDKIPKHLQQELDEPKRKQSYSYEYRRGEYVALSYTWGPPTPTREVVVDGASVQVRENLEIALRQLRRYRKIRGGTRIFVDAICIDQENTEERSQQVAMMRLIYRSATQVVVWIGGEVTPEDDLALTAVKYMSLLGSKGSRDQLYRRNKWGNNNLRVRLFLCNFDIITGPPNKSRLKRVVYDALLQFFSEAYWRRLWIVQELALGSSDTPVLYGRRCISWRDIVTAAHLIREDEDNLGKDIINRVRLKRPFKPGAYTWDLTGDRLARRGDTQSSPSTLWGLTLSLMNVQNSVRNDVRNATPYVAFNISRSTNATDERDRVFGILGLPGIHDRVRLYPDYTQTSAQVYCAFAKAIVENGDLNILRSVNRPAGALDSRLLSKLSKNVYWSLHGLQIDFYHGRNLAATPMSIETTCLISTPSWVPCWECPGLPTVPLPSKFSAAASIQPNPHVSLSTLSTQAVLFDYITNLSSFHCLEADRSYPHNTSTTPHVYGTAEHLAEALWRTLITDKTRSGDLAPPSYSFILTYELWKGYMVQTRTNGFGMSDFLLRNSEFQLFEEGSLEEFITQHAQRWTPKSKWWEINRTLILKKQETNYCFRVSGETKEQREAAAWAMNVLAWRRLVTTKGGYLGLVPAAARCGDVVAVLMGCDTPLVLRRRDGEYEVVGECYVHGIMHGEVIDMVTDGKQKIEEITLC